MRSIQSIRENPGRILAIGNYRPGYQAILDFDYLCDRDAPSIAGIITSSSRFQKYFWGDTEVLIPCFSTITEAREELGSVAWMLNISSNRRAYSSTNEFFEAFPDADGGHIFAEDLPELHAIEIYNRYQQNDKTIIGPAGVGLLVPGYLRLGVIAGVDYRQIEKNSLTTAGNIAVLSASGGMTTEMLTILGSSGHHISFGLCFGGDRWPATAPRDAFLAAEADPATESIVYYGELGGTDEYEIADLVANGQVTKPVTAYISGVISENFDQPVQFGHAKALAGSADETASAKRNRLAEVGVNVATSMTDFSQKLKSLPTMQSTHSQSRPMPRRHASRFSSTISHESNDGYEFVGRSLQSWAHEGDMARQIATALLGREPHSQTTVDFVRTVFMLSIDHGPQVSGALNTIVTARAGKGLVDSLAAGLLTIGPRFGGAVSGAAREWFDGVDQARDPKSHTESYAKQKRYISGIGHKKYRLGLPDPRVALLAEFASQLSTHPHYDYALAIEALTSSKKGSLILNVDGTIAALMLDILQSEESMNSKELQLLIDADFFNALFVIPRSVGFIAHYLDQKRLDEGLFRLPDDDVLLA